jgi:hypothetical protein
LGAGVDRVRGLVIVSVPHFDGTAPDRLGDGWRARQMFSRRVVEVLTLNPSVDDELIGGAVFAVYMFAASAAVVVGALALAKLF